jgi:aspartate aminotransferase-like enzyme
MSYKLFIPGPVAVSKKTLRAMAQPMIGHRSSDFVALYQSLQPDLQALFYTTDPVYLSTTSAWGMMEAAVRNVIQKKVLNCMNGAFSDKWNDVANRCGKAAGALKFEWGQPVDPEAVRRELATGQYDAVTVIHNETSCGCMTDIAAVMAVVCQFPEVISVVDTVSSFSALAIKKDELGIDIMITGTQKALALPPGLSLCSVSKRALARAATVTQRGYYLDLLEFQTNHEKGMTPSTPSIPHIYGLKSKLEDIKAEGVEPRYARHARLNQTVRAWAFAKGFKLFPRGLRFGHAQLLRQLAQSRPAGPAQGAQGQARLRHRRRLRQAQGQDLPHLQHGRRDRRDHRRPAQGPRQRAGGNAQAAGLSRRSPPPRGGTIRWPRRRGMASAAAVRGGAFCLFAGRPGHQHRGHPALS